MRWTTRRRALLGVCAGLLVLHPLPLAAQCPDGSAPPCGRGAARAAPAPNSVAVLYFETHDSADAYLADGLTEDLTSLLGNVASVQVKSPGMVRRAQRAAPGNAPAIAHALGVRFLVDGSVRRIGPRLRISTRLLLGATAVTAWGDVFDRTPDELLALPSVIAREVATRVGGGPPLESAALGTLLTRSPAAYDHYLRGNFFLSQRSQLGSTRALEEYREAERLDSGFAAAIGRAAYVHAVARANYYRLPDAPLDSLAIQGLADVDRALRHDSGSSDAWMARGLLSVYANPRTLAGAVQSFERAITLDPRNAEAHHQYAQVLEYLGRHSDADRELRTALAIEPGRAVSYVDLAFVHCRDTLLAVALADSAVALDPASPLIRRRRALARLVAGDVRGAVDDAELANRLQPGDITMENLLALVLARAGDSTRARTLISHWAGRTDHWYVFAALVAVGDTAAALTGLELARPDAGYWLALHFPPFDALHGNARYQRLLVALRPDGAAGP